MSLINSAMSIDSDIQKKVPKVSAIIPAYNSMKYLPITLESVLQQTFEDFEILIIDDGSSDNITQWYQTVRDPRVKLITQLNQGVSAARNTGIANARGEYIALVDADDLWKSNKLEKQVNCLDNNPQLGLVHTWMAIIDLDGNYTGKILTSEAQGNAWQELVQRNVIYLSSVLVRRSCFETVGGFNCHLQAKAGVEDWDMWLRITARYPIAVIKQPLALYRRHHHNNSQNYLNVLQDAYTIIETAFKDAPSELLYLKNRSYGYINLYFGWQCIQSSQGNSRQARSFCQQAVKHYPRLLFSLNYWQLNIVMLMKQWLSGDRYQKYLQLVYTLRKYINLSSIGINTNPHP